MCILISTLSLQNKEYEVPAVVKSLCEHNLTKWNGMTETDDNALKTVRKVNGSALIYHFFNEHFVLQCFTSCLADFLPSIAIPVFWTMSWHFKQQFLRQIFKKNCFWEPSKYSYALYDIEYEVFGNE